MDRHRDLDRDRNFLLHVHWIWMRDGHFHFFGDGNGLHVTFVMGVPTAETAAAETATAETTTAKVVTSKTEILVTPKRNATSMSETSASIPQIVQSSFYCLAVFLLLLFSQSYSGYE
jgi:hypothetical protein